MQVKNRESKDRARARGVVKVRRQQNTMIRQGQEEDNRALGNGKEKR